MITFISFVKVDHCFFNGAVGFNIVPKNYLRPAVAYSATCLTAAEIELSIPAQAELVPSSATKTNNTNNDSETDMNTEHADRGLATHKQAAADCTYRSEQ